VPAGRTQAFTATGTFSDATTRELTDQVTWASSMTAVAQISNADGSRAVATGLAVGTTSITATLGDIAGTATLTVTDAALVSIAVTPFVASVPAGRTQAFIATGTFSDATTRALTDQVTWASSMTAVALISNAAGTRGVATGLVAGTTSISATLGDIAGTATLTVTDAVLVSIAVTPVNPSVPIGRTQAFTATGTFSDATTHALTDQVTWASSVTAVAQISNADGSRGVATGLAVGTTSITATLGGITGTATLTVTDAVLVSIALTPAASVVPRHRTRQLTATGGFSDGSTRDVTAQVTWASSATQIATISNTDGSRGVATGLVVGTTNVTATLAGVAATTILTVIDFGLIDFGYKDCVTDSFEEGATVSGLEHSVDSNRFASVRWLDPGGHAYSIDMRVTAFGDFDFPCIPIRLFVQGQPMSLILIGSSGNTTAAFLGSFLPTGSSFALEDLALQLTP
ncbi:MAG TPA: Ig-like domain-containing protein, partial [Kofleriaceae bacterium]|nr:Ig-like domain-containing protein [Kofleriaceae bacterium]